MHLGLAYVTVNGLGLLALKAMPAMHSALVGCLCECGLFSLS